MRILSRRELLIAGGSALVLVACGSGTTASSGAGGRLVEAADPAIERRDARRRTPGAATVASTVTAAPVTVNIGGREVSTWAFGDRPGAGGIRAKVGDLIEATFVNDLPSGNTLHWHGIALRNDMDGVHDLTQSMVEPSGKFTYRFTVPDAGTYWFHPHMGLELDRGLYAPLIVEDPNDPVASDVDVTLLLDDWLDGYGRTQEDVLAELQSGGGHSGHMGNMGNMGSGDMGNMGSMMGGLNGDVVYPLHVINGRAPSDRETIDAKPGQRVRIRLINAGSDTAYRVAIGGHRLTVTHADGFPVNPVEVDTVVLGMGERYDVIVTAGSGSFPIIAVPEGKSDPAGEAVLRTSSTAAAPTVGSRPAELSGRELVYSDLVATDAVRLRARVLVTDGNSSRVSIRRRIPCRCSRALPRLAMQSEVGGVHGQTRSSFASSLSGVGSGRLAMTVRQRSSGSNVLRSSFSISISEPESSCGSFVLAVPELTRRSSRNIGALESAYEAGSGRSPPLSYSGEV